MFFISYRTGSIKVQKHLRKISVEKKRLDIINFAGSISGPRFRKVPKQIYKVRDYCERFIFGICLVINFPDLGPADRLQTHLFI